MKKQVTAILFAILLSVLSVFMLPGCAASKPQPVADEKVALVLPTVEETVEDELQAQLSDESTISDRLPSTESTELTGSQSEQDSMRLWIAEYDMNYTVENAEGARMVTKKGQITENTLGAQWLTGTVDGVSTSVYAVPCSERYQFSYQKPHDDCYFKTSWEPNKLFASVKGSGIETVVCSLDEVCVTGENMEYTIKYYVDNPDQVIVKATGTGNEVCLSRTADGFCLTCDREAVLELPDFYEYRAVKSLQVTAGQTGVLEGLSKGYDAVLYIE